MADEIDRGNEEAQRFLDLAISAARGIQPADTVSADECAICGGIIPQARRNAVPGCQCCTPCAERLEARKARGLV